MKGEHLFRITLQEQNGTEYDAEAPCTFDILNDELTGTCDDTDLKRDDWTVPDKSGTLPAKK